MFPKYKYADVSEACRTHSGNVERTFDALVRRMPKDKRSAEWVSGLWSRLRRYWRVITRDGLAIRTTHSSSITVETLGYLSHGRYVRALETRETKIGKLWIRHSRGWSCATRKGVVLMERARKPYALKDLERAVKEQKEFAVVRERRNSRTKESMGLGSAKQKSRGDSMEGDGGGRSKPKKHKKHRHKKEKTKSPKARSGVGGGNGATPLFTPIFDDDKQRGAAPLGHAPVDPFGTSDPFADDTADALASTATTNIKSPVAEATGPAVAPPSTDSARVRSVPRFTSLPDDAAVGSGAPNAAGRDAKGTADDPELTVFSRISGVAPLNRAGAAAAGERASKSPKLEEDSWLRGDSILNLQDVTQEKPKAKPQKPTLSQLNARNLHFSPPKSATHMPRPSPLEKQQSVDVFFGKKPTGGFP